MQTQNANWQQWLTALLVVIIGLGMFFWVPTLIPDAPVIPEIVMPVVPTAAEIAALINVPKVDTFFSVHDEKEAMAIELAFDEMDERDFRADLADSISDECDSTNFDRQDITSLSIRDADLNSRGRLNLELKVYFDNFGDTEEPEYARVDVQFTVEDLDWSDDFEDAEVTGWTIEEVTSCSSD